MKSEKWEDAGFGSESGRSDAQSGSWLHHPDAMRDHTSLLAWQRARTVARGTIRLAIQHWVPAAGPIIQQLQRAALSVQLNITEGYGLQAHAAFRRHLRIAYGSAIEAADLLALLGEFELAPVSLLDNLTKANRDSQYLLLGLIRKLS